MAKGKQGKADASSAKPKKGSGKGWKNQGSKAKGASKHNTGSKSTNTSGGRKNRRGRSPAAAAAAAAAANKAPRKPAKTVSYSDEHSILVCGDGDFSFTRGLLRHRATGAGVVATSLDSHTTVLGKYPEAQQWLDELRDVKVVHGVDATRLQQHLKPQQLFDRVVFNFPHTGEQRVHLNRNLLRDFFRSVRAYVKCAPDGGEVHVTLKQGPPYNGWEINDMAAHSGMLPIRTLTFDPASFPGYRHQTTDPTATALDTRGSKVHVFGRARCGELDGGHVPPAPLAMHAASASTAAAAAAFATGGNAAAAEHSAEPPPSDGGDVSDALVSVDGGSDHGGDDSEGSESEGVQQSSVGRGGSGGPRGTAAARRRGGQLAAVNRARRVEGRGVVKLHHVDMPHGFFVPLHRLFWAQAPVWWHRGRKWTECDFLLD